MNFVRGWRNFLKSERSDIRGLCVNNATNAFKRTGIYPFNPFAEAWTDAIQSLGQGQKPDTGACYEIFPNENSEQLAEQESAILCKGLKHLNPNFHDLAFANIRAMHILGYWRESILTAVSEGKNYELYSHTLSPCLPKTEAEHFAM